MPKMFNSIKNKIKSVVSKGASIEHNNLYRYDTKEFRERTVKYLYNYAKGKRSDQEYKWRLYDNYYNNQHVAQQEVYEYCVNNNIPWLPAIIPDPYIHVESQINPDVPDFEFNGRDDDLDSQKAKQRQYVVQYVVDNNDMECMNTENERDLGKLGNAFYKVSYDAKKQKPGGIWGDIVISNPKCEEIFHDPSAYDIDDSEYVDYVYNMHRLRVARMFKNELKELNMTIEDFGSNTGYKDTNLLNSTLHDTNDDTVQIIEHWFRQPYDGSDTVEIDVNGTKERITVEWESGDIACSILINGKEIKYIPKFWIKTGKQNKMYPFSKYCKVPNSKSFWDRSDIEMIKDLVDATDRELAMAILNDTYTANDIIIAEANAFAEDEVPINEPGAIWKVREGKTGAIQRLKGMGGNIGMWDTINKLREIIQETIGNFDSSMGKEPARVTTASGIAQMNERADYRKNIKKADRTAGYKRLYKLIDYMALEFFDDNRMIYLGAKTEGEQPIIFQYNSDNIMQQDPMTGESYIPEVDVKVVASDPLTKSKSFTLASTENLITKPITMENYKLVQSMVDIMNLPNRKEIKQDLEETFASRKQLENVKMAAEINNIQNPQPKVNINANANVGNGNNEPSYEEIIAGLSPEEQQIIHDNPDILINAMEGGGVNG